MKARLPTVVGRIQCLETNERTGGFANGWRLRRRDARQARLTETAGLADAQAQGGVAGECDRRMAQAHVAGDGQPRAGNVEPVGLQSILGQQWQRIVTMAKHRLGQALREADRQVAEFDALGSHEPRATD